MKMFLKKEEERDDLLKMFLKKEEEWDNLRVCDCYPGQDLILYFNIICPTNKSKTSHGNLILLSYKCDWLWYITVYTTLGAGDLITVHL